MTPEETERWIAHTREQYVKLVQSGDTEAIVKRLMYLHSECVETSAAVQKDKTVQHLYRRLWALQRRLKAARLAAIEYKRGKDFDDLARKKLAELPPCPDPPASRSPGTSRSPN